MHSYSTYSSASDRKKSLFSLIELLACRPKPFLCQNTFTGSELFPEALATKKVSEKIISGKAWRRQAKARFSLIELLVVVTILLVLISLLLPTLPKVTAKAKHARWLAYIRHIRSDSNVTECFDFEDSPKSILKNYALGLNEQWQYYGSSDGIFKGSPTWTTGRWWKKGALFFNGSDACVYNDGQNTNVSTEVTVIVSFKPLAFPAQVVGKEAIFKISLSAAGNISFLTGNGWGSTNLISSEALSIGQWYHVAATYDGAIKKIYINGKQDPATRSTTGSMASSWNLLFVIAAYDDYNNPITFFSNLIVDEVVVYNRALSDREIKNHYEMGK